MLLIMTGFALFFSAYGIEYCRDSTTPQPLFSLCFSPLGNPGWQELKVPFLRSPSAPYSQVRVISLSFFFLLTSESRSLLRPVRKHLWMHCRGSFRPICGYFLHSLPAGCGVGLFLWDRMCSWLWMLYRLRSDCLLVIKWPWQLCRP